jgi:hypothetical protein
MDGPGAARPPFRRAEAPRVLSSSFDLELAPLRWAGGIMLALGGVLPHLSGNPGLPCPLRSLTGVPCPLCGMTTSVKAVMGAHVRAAFDANPFGLLAVVCAVALLLRPRATRLRIPSLLVVLGLASSWAFELHRFHFL